MDTIRNEHVSEIKAGQVLASLYPVKRCESFYSSIFFLNLLAWGRQTPGLVMFTLVSKLLTKSARAHTIEVICFPILNKMWSALWFRQATKDAKGIEKLSLVQRNMYIINYKVQKSMRVNGNEVP